MLSGSDFPEKEGLTIEVKPSEPEEQSAPKAKNRLRLQALLFIATVFTTLLSDAMQQGANLFTDPASIAKGASFSFALLAILLTHELGHYFTSRMHGVEATLPYFIPAPPPFIAGTFGAFIKMHSPTNKRSLFDIGVAGPLSGFVVSTIAIIVGLKYSRWIPVADQIGALKLGTSLGFEALSNLVLGKTPEGQDILLHPVAFAGWLGYFVTSLNLIPIGQLDGGHISYSIFGERHEKISMAMVIILVVLGLFGWPGWYLWAFLTGFVLGFKHPPITDPYVNLNFGRRILGGIALIVFVLTFVPVPFMGF